MTAIVRTRVTLTLEVTVGSFGDEWIMGSLNKDARRQLNEALDKLSVLANQHGMRLTKLASRGLSVDFADIG